MSIFNSSVVIKQGYMVKRSQNKKLYTLVNYKKRWFVLTKKYLIYYEDDNAAKKKEKGRVELDRVHTIESAQCFFSNEEVGVDGELFPFLVGYHQDDDYTLFLLTIRSLDRVEWILAIREACANNKNVKYYFHPAPWNGRKWHCCKINTKLAEGCRECSTWVPIQNGSPSKDSVKENLKNKENINTLTDRDRNEDIDGIELLDELQFLSVVEA
ncbi:hypothetical protein GWI33_021084 [Rhynchophorus ferrugineus]|uniref:PH domain-containing protein n=1 Tax=Rhynchophorus ferrugineus TaxID=354439 RepID=A0A834HVE2_RHYFE|nr:hypothetical protein GWI33_021084 [Rhynchophorus ferrugineus]